ncbi:MAG TPA: hypothetical protein DCS28_04000 [Candidatus Moranbacteria bacterium]|nr:hypothetical protein [Candidatus Moranbacteria bacterium]
MGIFFIIFLINLKVNSQFYLSSLKGLINSFSAEESSLSSVSALSYLLKIFYYYNILPFLLIGLTGISYFIWKKRYDLLVPFFIILPIFIYLIHPGISIDHPWMLRRFSFAIIPLGIFCAVLIIDRLFSKKLYFFPLAFILVAGNLFFSTPYWNFSENKNLLAQTKTLSENFDNNDLILVDRLASGNGWSMISGPLNFLYGKQAAYFFNPTDLDKIDATKFDNIYFIIPDQSLALYEKFGLPEKLIPQKDYSLQRSYLDTTDIDTTSGIFSNLPLKSESVTQGKIYLLKK